MKNTSQADKAYSILKQKIIDQELRQGAPVVETDIANELQMSRTPVRDAIRRLASDGLLEIIPRKGTYIKTFTIDDLVKLYEIAEGLEGMAAYLVAEKVKEDRVAQEAISFLDEKLNEMVELAKDRNFRSWSESDAQFHGELYALTGNELIKTTLLRIRTQLNITLLNVIPSYANTEISNQEHIDLLDAVKKGDPELARRISQKQHHRIRTSLLEHSGRR